MASSELQLTIKDLFAWLWSRLRRVLAGSSKDYTVEIWLSQVTMKSYASPKLPTY